MVHIPVLLKETIEALDPKPNENFIDGTFGCGGHSLAILKKIVPQGKVLGIEWDRQMLAQIPKEIFQNPRVIIVNDSYANIAAIARKHGFVDINGILFDLGMSWWHIDQSRKGFSFSKDEPLDMRYAAVGVTAKEIVNEYPVKELTRIFNDYGQEKYAQKIARAIEKTRHQKPILTTAALTRVIEKETPPPNRIKTNARIFQALRIKVNSEFENIKKGINDGFRILAPGGRMAAISFHSLEDGIVKQEFNELIKQEKAKPMFRKPIVPSPQEIKNNPKSRSAKLRVMVKI